MEKEFIPYKQALTLKELGFDEPCFTKFENYFNKTKLHPIITTLYLNSPYENEYNGYDQKIINDETKRWFFTGYKNSVKDHNQDILSAPTFSQAFRFFREKYKLSGLIEIGTQEFSYQVFDNKGNRQLGTEPMNYNGTYEEAELECLKKLIEIIKNK